MKTLIQAALAQQNITVCDAALLQMAGFWEYLKEVNEHMNLTSVVSDEEAAGRHFADSLAPLSHGLIPAGAKLLDLGTGAGFPGMPLAAACPQTEVTLMDSLGKRIDFLKEASARFGIRTVCVHARAEEAAKAGSPYRDTFDIVTARAVARLNVLCELALPFVKPGGLLIAYKGPAAAEELEEAKSAIKRLGGGNASIVDCGIAGRESRLVLVRKLAPTPRTFPRRPGDAGRKPIV